MLLEVRDGFNQPRAYRLSATTSELQVWLTQQAWRRVLTSRPASRFAEFNPPFIPPTEKDWGFGPFLHTCERSGSDEVLIRCPLPRVRVGVLAWNHELGRAVCASLAAVFLPLESLEPEPSDEQQGVVITGISAGSHFGLSAALSPWLLGQVFRPSARKTGQQEVLSHLRWAYAHLMSEREPDYHNPDLWVRFDSGQPDSDEIGHVSISCPGDRAGLFPPHGNGQQYQLVDHNTDNGAQFLSLMAALAGLDQAALWVPDRTD